MTRAELEAAVYEETGYTSAPDSRVVSRIRRFLTEGVRAVLSEPGLGLLADSDTPMTIASVVGQARYVLPETVARMLHISERTNDWRLTPMSLATYRLLDPDAATTSGTPTHYIPIGRVGVAVQPSNASEIFVKSSVAGDVGTAYLDGLVTGQAQRTAAVTMTGVTAVSLNVAITTFIELMDFYLSAPAVGTVTLHEDSGVGTELARITTGKTRPVYFGFYLWPTPAAVVTYYVDYRRDLIPLAANTSVPPWPTDFHELLVAYADWREFTFKGDVEQAAVAQGRYQQWLGRLKYSTQVQSDDLIVMGRRKRIGHSRLGSYFPADTWSRW
jgi:hypothetical protein